MSASAHRRLHDSKFLVGHWPLNGHAQDVSGHGNHGTWAGTAAYATGPFSGHQTASLDGKTQYMTVTDAASLAFDTGEFSVSAMIHSPAGPTDVVGSILDKFDQTNKRGWALNAGPVGSEGNTRRVEFIVNNGVSATIWTERAAKLGEEANIYSLAVYNGKLYGGTAANGKLYEWTSGANATYDYELSAGHHHIVGVKAASEVRLYIDGVLVASQASAAYDTDSLNTLLIGSGYVDLFCGYLSRGRVYGCALTGDEVAALYEYDTR